MKDQYEIRVSFSEQYDTPEQTTLTVVGVPRETWTYQKFIEDARELKEFFFSAVPLQTQQVFFSMMNNQPIPTEEQLIGKAKEIESKKDSCV